jgi:hypothetical protein
MDISYVMACECGHEQPGTADSMRLGAVYRCEGCKQAWACVRPEIGSTAWVRVQESDVAFHRLILTPEQRAEYEREIADDEGDKSGHPADAQRA